MDRCGRARKRWNFKLVYDIMLSTALGMVTLFFRYAIAPAQRRRRPGDHRPW